MSFDSEISSVSHFLCQGKPDIGSPMLCLHAATNVWVCCLAIRFWKPISLKGIPVAFTYDMQCTAHQNDTRVEGRIIHLGAAQHLAAKRILNNSPGTDMGPSVGML